MRWEDFRRSDNVEDDRGGGGGFGGERGPSTSQINLPPDRKPDHVVEYQTRPDQGAIYRL